MAVIMSWRPRLHKKGMITAVWLCLLSSLPALALDPSKDVFQYNCLTWTRETGLPANTINSIVQTADGDLWLATHTGLIRFDGIEFKRVNTSSVQGSENADVAQLAIDPAERSAFWMGCVDPGRVAYYDGQKIFRLETGITNTTEGAFQSLCVAKDGTVWVGLGAGILRLPPGSKDLKSLTLDTNVSNVSSISEGRNGRVWVGTAFQGIHYWQGGKMSQFPDAALVSEKLIAKAIVEDRQGNLWVGTHLGLRHYDAAFHLMEIPSEMVGTEVKCLLLDRQGTLWIGSSGLGLLCYRNGKLTRLWKQDGLADDNVWSLA